MIAGYSLSIVAIVIGVLYLYIAPVQFTRATGITAIIMKYAHSVCWFLLAGAAVCFARNTTGIYLRVFAYGALGMYILFLLSILFVDY